ncbi:MAG: WD40/YVTN/BNR-like repeat-containing protein [Bacteroidia bacterium]
MNYQQTTLRTLTLFLLLLPGTNALAQWNDLAPINNGAFHKIDFVSEETGFALAALNRSNTAVFSTNNGGASWDSIGIDWLSGKNFTIQDIDFVDENTGFVTVRIATSELTSIVLKTTDGGKSWSSVGPSGIPVGMGFSGVQFVDDKTGWVGVGNGLYSTTDGGDTWHMDTLARFHSINDVCLFNNKRGIAVAWDGTFFYKGILYITDDAGANWDTITFERNYTTIKRAQYLDSTTIFALAQTHWEKGQRIFKTYDHGKSWDTLLIEFVLDSNDQMEDMYFNTTRIGHAITQKGHIYRTIDGGETWTHQYTTEQNMQFLTSNGKSLFACGAWGVLLENDEILFTPHAETKSFGLFPNPCTANGILRTDMPDGTFVQIHDLSGKHIGIIPVEQSRINLSELELPYGALVFSVPEIGMRKLILARE